MNLLSVVITTKNRLSILKQCLEALLTSTARDAIKDIVVVDDGSDDNETPVYLRAMTGTERIKYVRNEVSRGPAFARNRGIERVDSNFTLIIGDDVKVAPDTIEKFIEHVKNYGLDRASVIGHIQPWDYKLTAFEWWCSNGGSQFAYYRIKKEEQWDIGDEFFYTSNIITPTSVLRDYPFDESFPYARYEDRELGYRLKKAIDHKIRYLADAKSVHMHKIRFKSWLMNFDIFTWSALHFSKLYSGDIDLKRKLDIIAASEMENFCYNQLMDSVMLINKFHPLFFRDGKIFGQIWLKQMVANSFRTVQEFFRTTYYRRHLGLTPLTDSDTGINAEIATANLLSQIDDTA